MFFTVNRGRTRSTTFCLFLSKMIAELDLQDPNWRMTTIVMIDNAPYHRSKET